MLEYLTRELFPMILNMSLTASVVILLVLLVRLALRRAPKVFSYALWAVVLFRLLCPVSVGAGFSLLGLLDTPVRERESGASAAEFAAFLCCPHKTAPTGRGTFFPLPQ